MGKRAKHTNLQSSRRTKWVQFPLAVALFRPHLSSSHCAQSTAPMRPGQDADVLLAGRHASLRRHYPAVLWPVSPTDVSPFFHHCRRRRCRCCHHCHRLRNCFHCLLPSKLLLTAASLVSLEVVQEALERKTNEIFSFRNKLALFLGQ